MLNVGLDYLDRLPAREIPIYATAALEREAIETLRQMELFILPVEAWAGGKQRPVWNQLRAMALHQLGQKTDKRSAEEIEEERKAIAAVEEEIAKDFPIFRDPERLRRTYEQAMADRML